MSTAAVLAKPVWEDRWNRPSIDALLDVYAEGEFADVRSLLDLVDGLDQVDRSLTWFGTGWHWTIQYTLKDKSGAEIEPLCYIVPNPVGPIVSVPLHDVLIAQIPMRRYTKYVREGIRSAKQAVRLNWATWRPGHGLDMGQLFELVKSKHKYTLKPKEVRKRSGVKGKG